MEECAPQGGPEPLTQGAGRTAPRWVGGPPDGPGSVRPKVGRARNSRALPRLRNPHHQPDETTLNPPPLSKEGRPERPGAGPRPQVAEAEEAGPGRVPPARGAGALGPSMERDKPKGSDTALEHAFDRKRGKKLWKTSKMS